METTVTMPRLMTTNELAGYLGVKPQTIRDWRVRGRGPRATKFLGSVRYAALDVLEWIEQSGADGTERTEPRECACDPAGAHREGE